MARRAFYSFYYKPDNWRAGQVRNMGIIEGNPPVSDNDWETITKEGDTEIQNWINAQLVGKSVAIILIGANTAGRKWINYEIKKAWENKKGVLGIYIHNLKNREGEQTYKGTNPFYNIIINGNNLYGIAQTYDAPHTESKDVYNYIKDNLTDWVETAITIREKYD